MTNNTIILNEVFNAFTAEQRADMAAKIYTPEQIAAFMLRIDFHGEDVSEDEKTDTAAAYLLAENLHTFAEWKKCGKSVKQGEHAALVCYLWKYSDKPRKGAQKFAEGEAPAAVTEDEDDGNGYFYKTKSHLFGTWQVESTAERDARQAANVKVMTREELMAYNKKLAAERKKTALETPAKAARRAEICLNWKNEISARTEANHKKAAEQPAEVVAIIPAAAQPAPTTAQNAAQLDFASIAAGLIG